ncbi:glutamate-5-semialdehyde dehydrogenase [Acidipropionibacterium thoenii]|uniref:glutamate-5-semialdehyde dehydrogenase n=1 Tax=Acidipropionibacterium thoenii TaxID=1751 RepID=UPI00042787F3|nr:glutamate-5-semialdehyde dehydrogenase [Acidipropionibacterium thoenii]
MMFADQARAAKEATGPLRRLDRAAKDRALESMAARLRDATASVLSANRADLERGRAAGMSESLQDRLALTADRVEAMAAGLESLAGLPDPVGEVVRGWTTPQGVRIEQLRVPIGVIGIIYEARPNVTADAAGICLKSGNASLLRGSSSALESNRAVIAALRAGLADAGLPVDAVNLVEGGYDITDEMMHARGLVDLLIPRGGAGLINAVVTGSTVPVIETGTGNCHLVVDSSADLGMAERIILNAKTQRPSVCNALETVLVLAEVAATAVPRLVGALAAAGVTVHGDPRCVELDSRVVAAGEHEFEAEYLSLDLAMRVVADLDEAIAHIARYSSGHSETIVTSSLASAQLFQDSVDAAAVLVNCSSRFVDGGEFGFGAEIGISTQKTHARGPMGLIEMTSTSYRLTGDGQTRLG